MPAATAAPRRLRGRPAGLLHGLPGPCEVCRLWSPAGLCADCIGRYAVPVPRCLRCGLRLGLAAPTCGNCQREPPPYAATVCVADYAFPWDRLIGAFKFQGRAELAGVLASRLAAAVQAAGPALPDRVLPVPLSPRRLAERGYNQAWELARRTAALLGVPADATSLQRPLDTAHQADLDRAERQRNLRAAFLVEPRHQPPLRGLRLALVDDVMTTGATVREASTMLLRAGAASVDVWVLARTSA